MAHNDDLFDWLSNRPAWQQDAFLRALDGSPLAPQDLDEIIAMILEETTAPEPRALRRSDLPADLTPGTTIALNAIRHVEGVNRLAPGEELLLIGKGINVIYGHNGSGKSGWSRIPKHAGRAEATEAVLGDVYAEQGDRADPVGEIRWTGEAGPKTTRYRLDEPAPSDLAGMSVFDAACGQNLLSKDHEVDYVPSALTGLRRLAAAQSATIARIDERIADLRPRSALDLDPFPAGTKIRMGLERLSAETNIDAMRAAATVSPEQARHQKELEGQVAEIDGHKVEATALSAERDAGWLDALAEAVEQLAPHVNAAATAAARRERAAVVAAEQLLSQISASSFETEPLAGAGTESWMVLWRAAEAFAAQVHGEELPAGHDDARCPLCMQELSPDAEARLRRFRAFVSSDAEVQLAKARDAVERRRSELPDVAQIQATHGAALTLCDGDAELGGVVRTWLGAAAATATAIAVGEEAVPSSALPPVADIRSLAASRRATAAGLRELQDPVREGTLRQELADLRAAEALARRLESIEQRVRDLQEIARLERAKSALNTGPVSTRLRVMAGTFVTSELESALHDHLDRLNFKDVHVVGCSTSGREGNPRVGLKFHAKGKATLRQVLSDGEQRRLALAFFLAEVSVGSPGQPIVLDDPVCSVDHLGRRHIARTLARAARDRQVVIFTHELAFFEELVDAARAFDIDFHHQYVSRYSGKAGRVQADLPWEGASAAKRAKSLRNDLEQLEALHRREPDGETYARDAERLAQRLRQTFERAVEDHVIGGVVKRGDPGIHITQLRDVAWSPEIHQMARRGLDDNSPWAHDRSRASNPAPLTPGELREGLDLLGTLLQATKAVIDVRRQQHKELMPVPGAPTSAGGEVTELRPPLPGLSSGAA